MTHMYPGGVPWYLTMEDIIKLSKGELHVGQGLTI